MSTFRLTSIKFIVTSFFLLIFNSSHAAVDIVIDATLASSISSALATGDVVITTAGGNTPILIVA